MTYIQVILEDLANKKRILALNLKVKDYIFIDTKNLYFKIPSKKLDFKSYSLYLIDKIIGLYKYQLLLSYGSNVYYIFYINKLYLALDDPFFGQQLLSPTLLRVNNITNK